MVSERRSYLLLLMSRSTCRYRLKREPDAEFERAVKELAVRHPRFWLSARSRLVQARKFNGQSQTGGAGVAEIRAVSSRPNAEKETSGKRRRDARARCDAPEMRFGHTILCLTVMLQEGS